MIRITPSISLDEGEISWRFIRASGPGGQKVNTSSSAVQLRFDVRNSPSLPEDVRSRLMKMAAGRISSRGILVIDARTSRNQLQNRREALERLVTLISRAARKPKTRKQTRPSAAATARRLDRKSRHGRLKKQRGRIRTTEDH